MFPGQGGHTYGGQNPQQGFSNAQQQYQGNYGPPQGPPPGSFGYSQGNYGPPQGPPPGNYGPPPGAPPRQYGGGNDSNRGNSQSPYQLDGSVHQIPLAPQNFGQNSNMTFGYSNCQGRKKALLIGINYFGTKSELRGCINDVKNMSNFIVNRYGYKWEDIVILTDDQREMARVPTRENIIRAMQWLVKDARPNDSLVFHYSGHGGTTPDLNGDEELGLDDVIYPVDFERSGEIVDDDMHAIMVMPLPQGCKLTALYDSCHSGTALDLPYVYSTKGIVKEPNLLKDAGQGALTAFMSYERGDVMDAISSITGLAKKMTRSSGSNQEQVRQMKFSPADVVSISGCKDDQTSADALEGGQATGAMSWSFIKTLTENPQQLYLSLLNNMRVLLKQKYSQKPQLSCSHPQDMNMLFLM